MKQSNTPAIGTTSARWNDREWALGQLRSHLFEVGYLLEKNDPHFEKELADLTMITRHLVKEPLLTERFKKFVEKARGDNVKDILNTDYMKRNLNISPNIWGNVMLEDIFARYADSLGMLANPTTNYHKENKEAHELLCEQLAQILEDRAKNVTEEELTIVCTELHHLKIKSISSTPILFVENKINLMQEFVRVAMVTTDAPLFMYKIEAPKDHFDYDVCMAAIVITTSPEAAKLINPNGTKWNLIGEFWGNSEYYSDQWVTPSEVTVSCVGTPVEGAKDGDIVMVVHTSA